MKNFMLGLFLGIILGGAGFWYLLTPGEIYPRVESLEQDAQAVGKETVEAGREAAARVSAKLEAYELTPEKVQQELAETGQLVRRSAQQVREKTMDAAADTRITAAVKAKLARDLELSAWGIAVSTTDGQVTLSGKVESPELVGKAMLYALETEGVDVVISTLQVQRKETSS